MRCIAKVSDAYKLDTKAFRKFKTHSAIAYDDRILTWRTEKQFVTIWTVEGRQKIPYVCGERQRRLLDRQQGESDLVSYKGNFFLLAAGNVDEPEPGDVQDVLGVDLGIKNIVATSDGETLSGSAVNNRRCRFRKLREKLQKKGTKSAKRLAKKRGGKERRFMTAMNHLIALHLVLTAKRTQRAIALEDLTPMRTRTRAGRKQRSLLHGWAFRQLREFILYKARMYGVTVLLVDQRNSSRECSQCGYTDKRNRPSQAVFHCGSCGHHQHADLNAALVLRSRGRAVVNQPYAAAS